jgi:hypothetical protein
MALNFHFNKFNFKEIFTLTHFLTVLSKNSYKNHFLLFVQASNPLIEKKKIYSSYVNIHTPQLTCCCSRFFLQNIILLLSNVKADNEVESGENDTPEGYYAFIQSPSSFPPTVKPPPYQSINRDCIDFKNTKPIVSPNNLCGDLNKGKIPRNPMGKSHSFRRYV